MGVMVRDREVGSLNSSRTIKQGISEANDLERRSPLPTMTSPGTKGRDLSLGRGSRIPGPGQQESLGALLKSKRRNSEAEAPGFLSYYIPLASSFVPSRAATIFYVIMAITSAPIY